MIHEQPAAIISTADMTTFSTLLAAVKSAGIHPAGFARAGHEVLPLIEKLQPQFLISDLVLPGSDGLQLAQDVFCASLHRYPAIILLDPAGCALSMPKWLPDCGVAIVKKCAFGNVLSETLQMLRPENRSLPPDRQNQLVRILDDLGIPDHPGRQYLYDAVQLVWMDRIFLDNLKKRLYPAVSQRNSTDAARVERAMRYAIDTAWRTGDLVHQHRIFGDTIDARRGKPTTGEMVARLADILRWEGR